MQTALSIFEYLPLCTVSGAAAAWRKERRRGEKRHRDGSGKMGTSVWRWDKLDASGCVCTRHRKLAEQLPAKRKPILDLGPRGGLLSRSRETQSGQAEQRPGRGRAGVACADASRDTASTLRRSGLGCTGVSAECDTCERRRQLERERGKLRHMTYACMGAERELCSPPLGGQTGSAARRSAGRRQAQRARARGNERGGGRGLGDERGGSHLARETNSAATAQPVVTSSVI